MPRRLTIVVFAPLLVLGLGAVAHAKKKAAKTPPKEVPPVEAPAPPKEETPPPAPPSVEEEMPPEAEFTPQAKRAPVAEAAPVVPVATMVIPPHYGGAFRARWITLPSWFLGMFTKANRPLSSYGVGFEGVRRKRDAENPNRFWEISLGVGYQNMSPPDGNWLGNNHTASTDTDWVQFKNLGLWTVDLSVIQRQFFNEVFGVHYGAGLGLGIVQGEVLRTSSAGCTEKDIGNSKLCRPNVCLSPNGGCKDSELKGTESRPLGSDSPATPRRFRENSIPPAIPILNLVFGVDFRVPQAPGLEFRLDAGFFDALFLGGGVGYIY
jgi:hypothetical protein